MLLIALVASDNFDRADSNGDGTLSRGEFGAWVAEVASNMNPFLVPVKLADGTVVEGPSIDKDVASSTVKALLVIIVTELGDKTFFIAAILAMRHGRMVVYAGAMLALALMHILSCLMGLALPSLLPRKYTHFASAILFIYFGYKLLKEASEMGDGPSEELQEAEEELGKKNDSENPDTEEDLEGGGDGSKSPAGKSQGGAFLSQLMVGETFKVFSQAFTLTFLAEWGDRSQIATIGLAASKNVWGIIIGGVIGHALCTGLAVVGGKLLSTKISPRSVAYAGGALFLIFGIHAMIVE